MTEEANPTSAEPGGLLYLDALDVLIVVDNETDTLSSIDEGLPQVPEVVRLAARTPPTLRCNHLACKVVFDRLCCACHGFSVLLTGHRGDVRRSLLFDVGPYPDLWLDNADRLGVDLSSIDCLFLSHWHFDHSGGFPKVIAAIAAARAAAGASPPKVDLHPDRPDQRGIALPSGVMLTLPPEPGFDEIADAGADIVKHDQPHPLCDGFFHASGAIERVTRYETGLVGHHSFRSGACDSDPLIMDERYVAACVKERGVSVFSACSHAGIVNASLSARQQFPDLPIDMLLGGYHLAGKAMEPRIEETVRDLHDLIRPRVVAPGHCTGWRAKARLAGAFAPGHYAPSVVGSSYRLAAMPPGPGATSGTQA
jgi:7,8-dihydropterin-6-yl-methyl-4-(beta-D-ribofuranosyl)aminobenzene 5'-phosphate synthase